MSGKQERHGPDGPLNDLTGKAIVNDVPNESNDLGKDDVPGKKDDVPGTDGLGTDELALRRLLHGAVDELEPSQGALDHLRKAVPARRARRRQAVVGMAAAALFVGTAIPAFVHVSNSGSASDDRPSIAGHGQEAHGGTGGEKDEDGGKKEAGNPSDKPTSKDEKKKKDKEKGKEKGSSGGEGTGSGSGGDVPGTAAAAAPTCDPSQLAGTAGVGVPDAEGKVYGTFRIANVSGQECAVAGSGAVSFQAMGAADPARINVVEHTSGDAATGLPDPSMETTGLVLAPNMSYEVKFAWVPTDTCPTVDPTPDPTPTEDPSTGGTTDGGAASGGGAGGGGEGETEQTGTETQLGSEDGGTTAEGSISVSHTPDVGSPSSQATISNACAGTIYRTGVLAAS
ncbi:hypothetical protein [Streptomyces spiramyceticus]|uniref:hypothetical protein n=1 Tax=Streptomyces spiramyceticus TaxID=299717 RepID=UPI00237BB794|nr:hypothetical protein [Streptomyces spiramyceticus]